MKKLNISSKVLLAVFVGYALISTYFIVWSYRVYLHQAQENTLLRLQGIAHSLALQINGDEHQTLVQRYPQKNDIKSSVQDSIYFKIHQILYKNFEANMLKTPIYTMVLDSAKNQFVFAVTSETHPYYRHAYKSFPKVLQKNYETGGVISAYEDEFGSWLSAFAPIRNRQKQVVALVQVDQRYDFFTSNAQKMATQNILISVLFFIPIFIILIGLLRVILLREERFRKELEDAIKINADLTQRLEESLERITSIDELRKEMIANISHDLRTPMANVVGYIETLYLKQDNIEPIERRKYLQIILKETERLGKLVNELFDLSKLEANQVKAEIEPFSIAELTQDIIQKYQLKAQDKHIIIESNSFEHIPYVWGDIRWIDRVMQNLVDNAYKYNQEEGKIMVHLRKKEDFVEIKVSNTGKGIPNEMLKNIFDRYYKGEMNKSSDSTGLGLAIVKKILELHKTDIFVESIPNEMTSFVFKLPIFKGK